MWIFTKYGFFSAVCARQSVAMFGAPVNPDVIMVRARLKGHLEAIQWRFSDELGAIPIKEFQGTDYAYRMFMPKSLWVTLLAEMAAETDYDNFKSEVQDHQKKSKVDRIDGKSYLDALHVIWCEMHQVQCDHEDRKIPKNPSKKLKKNC